MSAIGDTLAGRFELRARLGSGGLGEVFAAHDRQTRREVVVKVLDVAPIAADKLTRLATLLRTATRVDHPAVALPRIQIGTSESPPFLAGERIAGEDLAELRRRAGPLSWQRALAIVHACTDALSALAAATGAAHRALKPGNIRVTADDEVRVLDFGIAELGVQPVPADEHGVVAEYRAPEQLAGAPGDPSSDVFTLGVLLFELTTGVHPFTGPTAFKAARAVTSQRAAPRPSALASATPLPSQVEALIVRALAPQPSQRFQDAAELARHLALIRRSPGLTPRTSAAPSPPTAEDDEPTQHGELPESAEDRTTIVSLPSASGRGSPPPNVGASETPKTEVPATHQRSVTTASPSIDAPTSERLEAPTPNRSLAPEVDHADTLEAPAPKIDHARAVEVERTEILTANRSTAPAAIARPDAPAGEQTEALPRNRPATPEVVRIGATEVERTEPLATNRPSMSKRVERADATLADRTEVGPTATTTPTTDDPVDKTFADRIDRTEVLPTRAQSADPTLVLSAAEPSPPRPVLAPREPSPAIVRSDDDDRTVLMARDPRPAAVANRPVPAAPAPAAAPPAARRSQLFWPALFCLISLALAFVALLIFLRS
ncbi:protein kinase [Nannocystis sp. ILAH1]|uniref:serine/threonine-protein kinase n=1 Tax=Nannocystis sp. ILAH1 TaxID=2996789 RepID=UPI00227096F4|nr:protein kinase [Nannocystis sp. ILAH1]